MTTRKISWDIVATQQFNQLIQYIANNSIQNAEMLTNEILQRIESLHVHPNRYPQDKYKINNDGNYRAFEYHRLRIAYHVSIKEIRILRIRSTFQEPQMY